MLDFKTIKLMSAKTGAIAMLLGATFLHAGGAEKHDQKDYLLALEVFETQSADKPHDVSLVKSSDGNMYVISCADRSGSSRFRATVKTLEGEKDAAAAARVPDCGGFVLVPGVVYRARWQNGDLKILAQGAGQGAKSKGKEATFTVIRAQKMTQQETQDCNVCVLVKEQ